jgi:hypothetical protein
MNIYIFVVGIRVPSFLEIYGNYKPDEQLATKTADFSQITSAKPNIVRPKTKTKISHHHYPQKMHDKYNLDMDSIRQYLDQVTGRKPSTELPPQISTPPFLVVNNKNAGGNSRPNANVKRLMEENRVLNHILQTLFTEEEAAKMKSEMTATAKPYKVIQLKTPVNKFFQPKPEKKEESPVVALLKRFENLEELKETLRDEPTFFTRIDGLHNLKKTSDWKRSLESLFQNIENPPKSNSTKSGRSKRSADPKADPYVLEVPEIFKEDYSQG